MSKKVWKENHVKTNVAQPGVKPPSEPSVAKDPGVATPASEPSVSKVHGVSPLAAVPSSGGPAPAMPFVASTFGKENVNPNHSDQVPSHHSGGQLTLGFPPTVEKPTVYSTSFDGESGKDITIG